MPVALALVAVTSLIGASAAGGDRAHGRVDVPGRLSLRVPPGWHVLHGWLSDVTDPAPRLAVASFPARLSRQTCACGFPNVARFPRSGAFVFVWEYLHPSRQMLASAPRRPPGFRLNRAEPRRFTCQGASETFTFDDRDREFQVEVYLGPAVTPATRARMLAILDSLRVGARG